MRRNRRKLEVLKRTAAKGRSSRRGLGELAWSNHLGHRAGRQMVRYNHRAASPASYATSLASRPRASGKTPCESPMGNLSHACARCSITRHAAISITSPLQQKKKNKRAAATPAGADPSHLARFTHSSLAGLPTITKQADGSTDSRRRRAEERLLSAIRLCDCNEPLDTLLLEHALLADLDAFWDAMRVNSSGRFALVSYSPAAEGGGAGGEEMMSWFRGRSFFTIGSFIASRVEVQLHKFLLQHVAKLPKQQLPPTPPLRALPPCGGRPCL